MNQKIAIEAGLASGEALLQLKIEHDEFWRKLHKENSPEVFLRIRLMLTILISGILGFIYGKLFTFIFGEIVPLTYPYGVIKCIILGTTVYVIGFEFGLFYNKYIFQITENPRTFPEIFSNLTANIINSQNINNALYEKPLKKRSNSENNIQTTILTGLKEIEHIFDEHKKKAEESTEECMGKSCDCEGLFACDKMKNKDV